MPKIIPFGFQILIEPFKEDSFLNPEGIKCLYGKVVAVGDQILEHQIKIGDILGYEKWGVKTISIKDKDYDFILYGSDFLLCKIDELTD